jgi:PAS domain S-box-containing protein
MKLSNWKILLKNILLPFIIFLIVVMAFWVFALPSMEKNLINSKKEMVMQLSNTVWHLMNNYHQKVKDHELTEKEAKEKIIEHVEDLRYGPSGKDYFWIHDLSPRMVIHPYRPELNGKDLSTYKDPNGKKLFVQMVEVCKEKGSGFVDYHWQWKDEPGKVEPKISYVKLFKPWGWIIGTGIYIDDVHEKTDQITSRMRYIFAGFGVLVLITSFFISINSIKTEEKLRESRARFKELFNLAPDPTFMLSSKGIFVEVNEAAKEKLGYEEKEILGLSLKKPIPFLPEKSREIAMKNFTNRLKGQEVAPYSFEAYTKDRQRLFFEVNVRPISKKGMITGEIVIARDVTDRMLWEKAMKQKNEELRAAEEELRASNEELAENNYKINLQKEEINKAKEKAEESDRLKSAFLANMSHEIRTPMNGIMGFSQLLSQKDLSPDKRNEYLNIIHSRTNHLLNIINDIVDVSKIEAGQLRIYLQDFYLNDMIQELYISYKKELEKSDKKNIELEVEYDLYHDESYLRSDPTRLRQVLDNLLSNALKYTNEGSIQFGYKKKSHDDLLFYVKDTGIGIGEEDKKHIFDRFRQADESSTRKYEGTGLGLTISRNLVNILGGEMWVESAKGEGSAFYFTVPFNNQGNYKVKEEKHDNVQKTKFSWEEKNILVVEDDPASSEFLKEILQPTGASLCFVNSGEEGYEKVEKENHFDLILMDIRLPGASGIEITRKIRKNNFTIPIIAQTAYAMGDDHKKCMQAGANDYVSKPIGVNDLLTIINKYI